MSLLKDRLLQRRKALGYTQKVLAKKAKISQTTIADIERGRNKGSGHITSLAQALKCDPIWLSEGKGKHPDDQFFLKDTPETDQQIPLIAWDDVGKKVENDHTDFVTTTIEIKDDIFALRVSGNSMEPMFRNGSLIIVDPSIKYENEDFVIAKDKNGKVVFSQLTQENSEWYLTPLNTRYPVQQLSGFDIAGVVVTAIINFK